MFRVSFDNPSMSIEFSSMINYVLHLMQLCQILKYRSMNEYESFHFCHATNFWINPCTSSMKYRSQEQNTRQDRAFYNTLVNQCSMELDNDFEIIIAFLWVLITKNRIVTLTEKWCQQSTVLDGISQRLIMTYVKNQELITADETLYYCFSI